LDYPVRMYVYYIFFLNIFMRKKYINKQSESKGVLKEKIILICLGVTLNNRGTDGFQTRPYGDIHPRCGISVPILNTLDFVIAIIS